jgi:hypothetical protein
MSSYKPGPQARYLVDKMADSEKMLLEAISKLSKKFDVYDKRLTSMGSDVSRYKPKWICRCVLYKPCRRSRFCW